MLQNIRDNSQSIVAKIIVGFIVVTFALWGVDSLVGLATGSSAPVTVNGVDISERQLVEGVELQRRQILAQLGAEADPSQLDDNLIRGMVLEGLIEQELLIQSAQGQGMKISNGLLDSIILATKEFQTEEGQFDRSRFESTLRNVGMTPLVYRDYLRREKLIEQERSGLLASSFSLPSELEQVAALDRQKRDLQFLTLPIAELEAGLTVDDEVLKARYEERADRLLTPEQVAIRYLELSKQSLLGEVELDESELRTQYQQMIASFESSESRHAAHILIEFGDDEQQAEQQINELAQQLEQGADFAELARERSQDFASAELGGDLGFMERGVFVPEFEEVLYQLSLDEVSGPVKTEFGYHLIKLLGVESNQPPSFEEAREQLAREQREQKAEALFVARSEELADLSFSSGDLAEPAAVLGLEIQESPLFSREGGETELTRHPRVLQAAFSGDVLKDGNNSELLELSRDRVMVLRIKEHREPRQRALDEVRDELIAELKREQAEQQLRERGDALIEAIRQAGNLDVVAGEGLSWQRVKGVDRGTAEIDPVVKAQAFAMPKPAGDGFTAELVALANGDLAIVAITAVQPGNLDEFTSEQQQALGQILAGRQGQAEYQDLLRSLKEMAEIERL